MSHHRRSAGIRLRRGALVAVVVVAALPAAGAIALAGRSVLRVASAHVSGPSGTRTESIAVNSRGVAVYELFPETSRHLLCTSSACLQIWPPVRAGAHLVKAAAIHGRLRTIRRHRFTQLTLSGHPLYTFAGDGGRRGIATGQGLHSFGGVWHVVAVRR